MHNFSYARAADLDGALRLVAQQGAQFIAGGTNLLDLMKGGVPSPDRLIDITQITALAQMPHQRLTDETAGAGDHRFHINPS